MEQRELNALEAVRKVLAHLNNHPADWQDCVPVSETKAEIEDVVQRIRAGGDQKAKDSRGATAEKDAALERLAETTALACRRASAYARKKGDLSLLAIVNQSRTDLSRGAEEEVLQRHRNVRDALRALSPNPTYQINDALIAAIDAGIATFESLRHQRDELVTHQRRATADMDPLFAELRQLLERLDDEVAGLIENESFVDGYFAARTIIDRPGTRTPNTPEVQ